MWICTQTHQFRHSNTPIYSDSTWIRVQHNFESDFLFRLNPGHFLYNTPTKPVAVIMELFKTYTQCQVFLVLGAKGFQTGVGRGVMFRQAWTPVEPLFLNQNTDLCWKPFQHVLFFFSMSFRFAFQHIANVYYSRPECHVLDDRLTCQSSKLILNSKPDIPNAMQSVSALQWRRSW